MIISILIIIIIIIIIIIWRCTKVERKIKVE